MKSLETKKLSLSMQIMIAMVAGITLGAIIAFWPDEHSLKWINEYIIGGLFSLVKTWFINSLKLIVVPLVFVSLVCGTCSLSDPKKLGSMSTKSIFLYTLTTAIAVTLGILLAVILEPGTGVALVKESTQAGEPISIFNMLKNLITTNPFHSFSEPSPNMLQIIIFSILFGLAISLSGEKGKLVASFFESMNEVVMKLVTMIMKFAPYGIFCVMAIVISKGNWDEIQSLINYFMLVVFALVVHAIIVYPSLLKIFAKLNPVTFFFKFRPVMLFAFGSSSSSATLPVTMEVAEKRLGVGNSTASFVLPLGATINMDGTAIMQGIATVFVAQQYGIDLSLTQYLIVILTASMASIGAAGIPSAGLILLIGVLSSVGLPTDTIAMIIGIDRLLDMTRTAVNVTGDATVATIVSRWENDFSKETFDDPNAGLDYEAEKLRVKG